MYTLHIQCIIHISTEISPECGLTLSTSFHQSSLSTHQTTLTPRIFNTFPFLTYIYIFYTILTQIIVFNCYAVTMTQ